MRPNWQERPVSTEIPKSSGNANGQPQANSYGAYAPLPRPQPMPQPTVIQQPPQPMAHAMPQPGQSMPQEGTLGACAPMPRHQPMPMTQPAFQSHPISDVHQQAYPHEEFWADHLEYDVTPVGYQPEPSGTYAYYPSYFQ